MAQKLFVRHRDGTIDVRLNEYGRSFIREQLTALADATSDAHHAWRPSLHQVIDPSSDVDDPVHGFEREKVVGDSVQLALLTLNDTKISVGEAWSWLRALQTALRAHAQQRGLVTSDDVESASDDDLEVVRQIQSLLFELAAALE